VTPNCTTNEIAEAIALTHRSVWGLIGDLRRAKMLLVRKEGRRHRYAINLDAPFCIRAWTVTRSGPFWVRFPRRRSSTLRHWGRH